MLHDAIQSLRPDKGFTMYNDDPDTIIWEDQSVVTPTKAEIAAAVKFLEAEKIADEAARKAAKQAVLDKLGLTAEELASALS
jgi:hypothetical protein